MTEQEAFERLQVMVAYDKSPTLSTQELDMLLTDVRRPDVYDRDPDDEEWEGTYDLERAAARGWQLKAAKVADKFTFAEDGQSYSMAELIENCLRMARLYKSGAAGTLYTGYVRGTGSYANTLRRGTYPWWWWDV